MHGSRLVTNPRQFASPSPPRAGFFHFWRTIIDRVLVYPGAIPLEVDVLNTNKNAAFALGQLCQDAFGQGVTGPFFTGLACVPNTPAAMNVIVQPGAVYAQAALDTTAYSSLAADSTVTMKQGILKTAQTFATPAPTTSGQSVVYLISASFLEADTNAVVLPYYNAANPSQAYSGPNGTGSSQNTTRQDTVALTLTTGVPATTGNQLTPATPNGQTALYTITVPYGATSVTASNIAKVSAAPFFAGFNQGRLLNVQTFTSSGTYTPTPGTTRCIVEMVGGGGGGGGAQATSSSQLALGGGGNAGSYIKALVVLATDNIAGQAVTVGAAGASGPVNTAGGNGGNSSVGSMIVAPGGAGGARGAAVSVPASGVTTNNTTMPSVTGTIQTLEAGAGASPPAVTAPSLTAFTVSNGCPSIYGAGGVAFTYPGGNGQLASTPGSGGGAGVASASQATGFAGGAGAAGKIIIMEFA